MTAEEPFLDTNVFIRHLTADHPAQSPRCRALFAQLEQGSIRAWTSHLVVAEIVFVVSRVYGFGRDQLVQALVPLLELPGLRIADRRLFRRVFEIFSTTNLSYPDSYHAALIERSADPRILSFDQGFDRLPNVTRIEP